MADQQLAGLAAPTNHTAAQRRLAAQATEMLLAQIALPTDQIPSVIAVFSSLAGPPIAAAPPAIAALPPKPVAATPRLPPPIAKPRVNSKTPPKKNASTGQPAEKWKAVRHTNPPLTPLEKIKIRVKGTALRLDDQTAMAVARASGKAVGRDMLEAIAETTDGNVMLTFGFVHGSAKFYVEFNPKAEHGIQAMTALVQLASEHI